MGNWDASFLGRKLMEGTVNSSRIAQMVCSMAEKTESNGKLPRYLISCSKEEGVLFTPVQPTEDEGFDSECETVSSDCSSEGRLCILRKETSKSCDCSSRSSASDSDDHRVAPKATTRKPPSKERYSISDIAFCHTDRLFPKILVLVIKIKCTKSKSDEPIGGLEALVYQFKSEEKLKELCRNYNDLRRRMKLDSQTNPGWTKTSKQKTRSREPRAINIPRTDLEEKTIRRSYRITEENAAAVSFNLVETTDNNGVTHIEVSTKGQELPGASPQEPDQPSSIISISAPESAPGPTSKSLKEIESIIRADISSEYTVSGENKLLWPDSQEPLSPPQRPERKKYARKSKPTVETDLSEAAERPDQAGFGGQKIISGMFVSVIVDPKKSFKPRGPEKMNPIVCSTGGPKMLRFTSNKARLLPAAKPKLGWKEYHSGACRCKNDENWPLGTRAFKTTSRKIPMAYRYIDSVPPTNLSFSDRFFGKLREIANGSCNGNLHRRQSDSDGLKRFHAYKYLSSDSTASEQSLKSVIKTKYKDGSNDNAGQKKVTFSAYATVQVVD